MAFKQDWQLFRDLINKYNIEYLYHFTDSANIPLIKQKRGLLSWWYCDKNGINIPCPGGNDLSRRLDTIKKLENYIHLCFNNNQPMCYKALQEGRLKDPIFLKIDPEVIYWKETKFSNINATDSFSIIGESFEDFNNIDFDIALNNRWCSEEEKKKHQAEVMVQQYIPLRYITF